MSAITFDTLAYSRNLQDAGMPREQADALAYAQKKAFGEMVTAKELATKGDLQDTRAALKQDIQDVRSELKQDIQDVRNELKQDIQNVRSELKQDIQNVRSELKQDIQNVRSELKQDIQDVRLEMKAMELRLLKWQIGLAITIIAIMAKGFGWLGF